MAIAAILQLVGGFKRKRRHRFVAGLFLQPGEINGGTQHPRGGAGFEPPQRHPHIQQRLGERGGGKHTVGTAVVADIPHENFAFQKGAGRQNHRAGAVLRLQPGGQQKTVRLAGQRHDLPLLDMQMLGGFQRVLHGGGIFPPVDLGAQRMHRRSFAAVEHPRLQHGCVGGASHLAAHRVDLAHQMPLGGATDTGVAGHIAHPIQIDGEDHGGTAQPRGGERRFDARVSRADHRHIIFAC